MISNRLREVLVIEDDRDIQIILKTSLEDIGGLSCRICSSAREGLEALASAPADLMLLDWMMPAMDGAEVLQALRGDRSTADLPVVVLTGKALPEEMARMRSLGAADVIAKPFDPLLLPELLAQAYDRSRANQ